jgi:predicted DCC family thiol-disulfide oxidoreductase YuxK
MTKSSMQLLAMVAGSSRIVLLTDGQCRFCEASMAWVQKKVDLDAIAYQDADLASYGLTYEECEKAVHVLHAHKVYVGPDAIAYLLGRRGNYLLGFIVRASGPMGRFGYKWVAGHRNSWIIRFATKVIERSL